MNDQEFTESLLDLCRLNLMEDHIEKSVSPDREDALTAIDRKRRQIAAALITEGERQGPRGVLAADGHAA